MAGSSTSPLGIPLALKPGYVAVSFSYSRAHGPRSVHGAVSLKFAPSDRFTFASEATWPSSDDYSSVVERAVREVLLRHGALDHTSVTLSAVLWDPVNSCESGFYSAAIEAAEAAFRV